MAKAKTVKTLAAIPKHGEPINGVSGKCYSGANVDELLGAMDDGGFEDPRWVTFKQALSVGRCVRKGEKAGAQITKWVEDKKAPKKGKGKPKLFPKAYCVFNIEQTDAQEDILVKDLGKDQIKGIKAAMRAAKR